MLQLDAAWQIGPENVAVSGIEYLMEALLTN
jgi:hypothetical protein